MDWTQPKNQNVSSPLLDCLQIYLSAGSFPNTAERYIMFYSYSFLCVMCFFFLYTNIIIFAKYLWCGSAGNTVGHLPLSNQIWNMSGQGSHYDWTRCLTTFHQHILTSSFEVIVRPYNLVRCIVERLKMQLIWSPMQLL